MSAVDNGPFFPYIKVMQRKLIITVLLSSLFLSRAEGACGRPLLAVPADWRALAPGEAGAYGKGFVRDASGAFVCDNGTNAASRGVAWNIRLNQSEPRAFTVAAEALACGVGEKEMDGSDFALYLDVSFADKTSLWGRESAFDLSETGWQRREVTVIPEKPVTVVHAYCLFRKRTGAARFRNFAYALQPEGAVTFDGAAIGNAEPLAGPGFLVRDVAAGSGFERIQKEALGLRLETRESPEGKFAVRLADTTGRDRAVTLLYVLPLGKEPVTWFVDPRRSEAIREREPEHRLVVSQPAGTGGLSRYPFGAVAAGGQGLALGIDPYAPAFYRVACNARTRELYIAFDIGLAREKPVAEFGFYRFPFPAADGFRGALAAYGARMPEDCRAVRVARQGLWMPFDAISKVKGWQDFGFAFKEGDDESAFDDAAGILTFRYREPMTWWMTMKGVKSLADAEVEARRRAAAGDLQAKAWLNCAFRNEWGGIPGLIRNEPWCEGVVWSVNSAPGIPGEPNDWQFKGFTPKDLAAFYSAPAPKGCDGEYVDSASGWVTDAMDFNRAHFAAMRTPLCFSPGSRRVGIFKGFISYEYIRALAENIHALGRYTMANGVPSEWSWLPPFLDVMGTETDWVRNGKWTPMSDGDLLYRRALAGGRPYCFLMNTDFTRLTHGMVEAYMCRCLAYGMFPGFFSANASTGRYFDQPALYERDRELFKKYVPLCRLVAEAGWRPVTGFRSDNPQIVVERFGAEKAYLTVYNLSDTEQGATLRGAPPVEKTPELVTGGEWVWAGGTAACRLPGGGVRVLRLF